MSKPDVLGRLIKWSIDLSQFDISFEPRTSIQAQAVADLLVEHFGLDSAPPEEGMRLLHTDGFSTSQGGGARVTLRDPLGVEIDYAIKLAFQVTNNEAEYEALIQGIRIARQNGAFQITVYVDSQLIASQIDGTYEAQETTMVRFLVKPKEIIA